MIFFSGFCVPRLPSLDDDNGRKTDRQTRKLAKLSSEWSTQYPKGTPATIACRHGTTCHETRFLFVRLLLRTGCNYIIGEMVSELDSVHALDLQCSGSIS